MPVPNIVYNMNTIKSSPLAARKTLLLQIEDEIVSGALPPGAHLAEVALARRLGVSRTPLRAALTQLAEMGWIRIVLNVGAFVREIQLGEVAELFMVRRALEGLAADLACRRWTPQMTRELRVLADRYKKYRLAGNYYKTRLTNCQFHRFIVDASDCQALMDIVQRSRLILRSEMARHPFEDRLGSTPSKTAVTHYDILNALSARDPARARTVAEQHLEQVRVRLLGEGLTGRDHP